MRTKIISLIGLACMGLAACGAEASDDDSDWESGSEEQSEDPSTEVVASTEQALGCGLVVVNGRSLYWNNCTSRCQKVKIDRVLCPDATISVPARSKRYVDTPKGGPCSVRTSGTRALGGC